MKKYIQVSLMTILFFSVFSITPSYSKDANLGGFQKSSNQGKIQLAYDYADQDRYYAEQDYRYEQQQENQRQEDEQRYYEDQRQYYEQQQEDQRLEEQYYEDQRRYYEQQQEDQRQEQQYYEDQRQYYEEQQVPYYDSTEDGQGREGYSGSSQSDSSGNSSKKSATQNKSSGSSFLETVFFIMISPIGWIIMFFGYKKYRELTGK